MDIGRLNKRITFYNYQETKDEFKRTVQKLVPYKTIWASVESLTGKEYQEAAKNANEQNFKIYTRYFSDLRNTDLIISYKGRKFTIQSVIDYRENHEMLLYMCVEKVGEVIE